MRRMQQAQQEPGPSAADERLAADWLTIWQSELAALAADPELHELRAALALRLAWPPVPE